MASKQRDTPRKALKRGGGNDVYPFVRRILTRAAHDEEAEAEDGERYARLLRDPARTRATLQDCTPRIGHCNHLFLHSSIEVGRACVERFRYGMNERKRRVETAIVFLRPANWRGNATLTLFADRL